MITSADVADVLYKDCEPFGIEIYPEGNVPDEHKELSSERVVICPKKQLHDPYWKKSYAEVNLCVPDKDGMARLQRLQELERQAHELFDGGIVGSYDGTSYYYYPESIGREKDTELKCHFVNVRILFEVLNY